MVQRQPLRGRWINEAFANQAAALAMAELGEEQPQPEAIERRRPGPPEAERLERSRSAGRGVRGPGALRLQHVLGRRSTPSPTRSASRRLHDVIVAAEAGAGRLPRARRPGGARPATSTGRSSLDLFEEVGGSEKAVGPLRAPRRERVRDGRTSRRGPWPGSTTPPCSRRATGWAAPTSVRLAMTDWRFDVGRGPHGGGHGGAGDEGGRSSTSSTTSRWPRSSRSRRPSRRRRTSRTSPPTADDALAAAESLPRRRRQSEADGRRAARRGRAALLRRRATTSTAAQAAFEVGRLRRGCRRRSDDVEDTMDGAAMAGVLRLLGLLVRRPPRSRAPGRCCAVVGPGAPQ